ncbi:MAG: hypothetical protein E7319_02005 [Clostridiales bacterium]|nr:hypothetical protein [Clostridiales bacterium]
MEVHVTYPKVKKRNFFVRNAHDLWRGLFTLVAYTCLIIDILTPGIHWSLIVIGALCVLWIALLYRPQVENTLIKKGCDVLVAVCLYLLLLESVVGGSWGTFVAQIVYFGMLVLMGVYFLFYFRRQKRNFLPLFEMLLAGMTATLVMLCLRVRLSWPMIVVGSVSLGIQLLMLILYWKPMMLEYHKKFHV